MIVSVFIVSDRRNEYTLITRHSQTLNHLTEQNDSVSPDSTISGLNENDKIVSDLYFASNERIPTQQSSSDMNALSAVIYNIYGFQISRIRQYLFHFISILFLGIPYLIFRWFSFGTQLKYRKCDLGESDVILGLLLITAIIYRTIFIIYKFHKILFLGFQ